MSEALPELIDIDTLALRLGDSVRHIRRLVAERRIPYLKVGHFVRFDPDEIAVWLDTQRISVTGISRRTFEGQGERQVSNVSGSDPSRWD
jgi:excisionase family DNA binding protein